jgi:acetyl esterase/lipase
MVPETPLAADDVLALVAPEFRAGLGTTLPPHLPDGPLDVATVRVIEEGLAAPAQPDAAARTVATEDGEGRTLVLRVHGPRVEEADPATGLPAILWIHGGGMFLGSALAEDAYCAGLVDRLGVAVVAVDYRLAPEHPYPAPLEDCLRALDWLAGRAPRIVVAGGSAGGGLAAALCLLDRDRGGSAINAAHLYYPMLDDRQATGSARRFAHAPVWNRRLADLAWSSYLAGRPADFYAAPARAADVSSLPPTYLDTGDLDLFADEVVEYARRLEAAGVDTRLHVVPGAVHAFERIAPDAPLSREVTTRRLAALARDLGVEVAPIQESP